MARASAIEQPQWIILPLKEWDRISNGLTLRNWHARYRPPSRAQVRPRDRGAALDELRDQILSGKDHSRLCTALVVSGWLPVTRAGGWQWVAIPYLVQALHALGHSLEEIRQIHAQGRRLTEHTHLRFGFDGEYVTPILFVHLAFEFAG